MRVLGLDPGLRRTGWGVIEVEGSRLRHLANGVIESDGDLDSAWSTATPAPRSSWEWRAAWCS
jgi:hypothetical protein